MAPAIDVLGQDLWPHLRHGYRHRNRSGVPVRYQLGGVLPLRGQRVRKSPGSRRDLRVHAGGRLPRPDALRWFQVGEPTLVVRDHHGRNRSDVLRDLDRDGQLVDAISSGLRGPRRGPWTSGVHDRLHRRGVHSHVHPTHPACARGIVDGGCRARDQRGRLVPVAQTSRGARKDDDPCRAATVRSALGASGLRVRIQPGCGCDSQPAREARCHGGPLSDPGLRPYVHHRLDQPWLR